MSTRPFHFFVLNQDLFFPPLWGSLGFRHEGAEPGVAGLIYQCRSPPSSSLLPYQKPSPGPTRATCQHITLPCHGWNSWCCPFLTRFSGTSYPLDTVIFQAVIYKVHWVSTSSLWTEKKTFYASFLWARLKQSRNFQSAECFLSQRIPLETPTHVQNAASKLWAQKCCPFLHTNEYFRWDVPAPLWAPGHWDGPGLLLEFLALSCSKIGVNKTQEKLFFEASL